MNNNEARGYFGKSGLTYKDMSISIHILILEVNKEIEKSSQDIGMKMTNRVIVNERDTIFGFYFFVDGNYFKKREAISFDSNGFIGFAGWASTNNCQPFINGFINTINYILQERANNY